MLFERIPISCFVLLCSCHSVGVQVCYANASLSVLLSLSGFVDSLRERARGNGIVAQLWELRCLSSLSPNPVYIPDIVDRFSWTAPLQRSVDTPSAAPNNEIVGGDWKIGTQQDADEFITRLLQTIDGAVSGSVMTSPSKHMRIDVVATCTCTTCQHSSSMRQSEYRIPLCFRDNDNNGISIVDMFSREYSAQQVSLNCAACGSKTATRSYSICSLPVYVPILLSRFRSCGNGRYSKVNTRVYVSEHFKLPNTTSGEMYNLCAAVVHRGTREFGHYYSYIIQPDWAPKVLCCDNICSLSFRMFHEFMLWCDCVRVVVFSC